MGNIRRNQKEVLEIKITVTEMKNNIAFDGSVNKLDTGKKEIS